MSHPNPDIRLKREYGSVKDALIYCVSLGLNKAQSARQLSIAVKTLRDRANRLKVTFPDGYATMDRTLISEVNREYMRNGNRNGTMGGRQRWGKV